MEGGSGHETLGLFERLQVARRYEAFELVVGAGLINRPFLGVVHEFSVIVSALSDADFVSIFVEVETGARSERRRRGRRLLVFHRPWSLDKEKDTRVIDRGSRERGVEQYLLRRRREVEKKERPRL